MNKLKKLIQTDAGRDGFLPTVKKALPFRIDPPGAREAVLLLHGLTGNPSEVSYLGRSLAEAGYAVYAPRHPGHGTSRADIFTTHAEDWVRGAFDAYLNLRAEYPKVNVLGHSMGGLLAAAVSITFDVPRLVLLAPAYLVTVKKIFWTPLISRFIKVRVRNRPIAESDLESPEQKRLHEQYWADDLLPPVAELFKLAVLSRKELVRLHSKTYVIVGEKDQVVPPSTAALIARCASNVGELETLVLKDAGHLFPFDAKAEETAKLVLAWMGPAGHE